MSMLILILLPCLCRAKSDFFIFSIGKLEVQVMANAPVAIINTVKLSYNFLISIRGANRNVSFLNGVSFSALGEVNRNLKECFYFVNAELQLDRVTLMSSLRLKWSAPFADVDRHCIVLSEMHQARTAFVR